jgi:hypothetical protein
MNLFKKNCYGLFAIALVMTLISSSIFPSFRLMFFIPYLIVLYYKQSYVKCLWGAFICGLIIDLLSSKTPLGLWSLNYAVTSIVLYKQRLNFFGDRQSTLPIMTFLFSVISTSLQWFSILIFESQFLPGMNSVLTEFVAMPFFDALYAYSFFILPWVIFYPLPRKGTDYFYS